MTVEGARRLIADEVARTRAMKEARRVDAQTRQDEARRRHAARERVALVAAIDECRREGEAYEAAARVSPQPHVSQSAAARAYGRMQELQERLRRLDARA
jgi:hypothetical protein